MKAKRLVRAMLSRPLASRVVTAAAYPFAGVLPDWVIGRIPVVREFDVAVPGTSRSFRMQTNRDVRRSVAVYWGGVEAWEPLTARVLVHFARPTTTFLDIGANVGLATFIVATESPSTTVHAFEPVPRSFEQLRRNVELNPRLSNVVLHQLGFSNASGEAIIHVPTDDGVAPETASLNLRGTQSEAIPIRLVTIDDFVRKLAIERVDLMKIDTEGTEHWILEGGLHTLTHHRPVIVCEILNSDQWVDEPASRAEAHIARILFPLDYHAFHLKESGPEACSALHPDPKYRDLNFIFVPSERAGELPPWFPLPDTGRHR